MDCSRVESPSTQRGGDQSLTFSLTFNDLSATFADLAEVPWTLIPELGSGGFISIPTTRDPEPGKPEGLIHHLGTGPSASRIT